VCEATADRAAAEAEEQPTCRVCGDVNVVESGLCRSCRKVVEEPETEEEAGPDHDGEQDDFPPDEGGESGIEDSTYQTDDRRSGLLFSDETPW
jgi:hypothetical protein